MIKEERILKTAWKKISNALSWVLMIVMILFAALSVYRSVQARTTGESYFLFGYRPILVLTGSMEPYMMTNGLALTKEVTDIDQLEVGDVVTYTVETESGTSALITHRITSIEDGKIYTKGDNIRVSDGYVLTIENIQAKVVGVCNATADIAATWNGSNAGKVMLISFPVAFIVGFYALRSWISMKREKRENADETVSEEDSSVG